jgi:uncharacterized damage-inducible protein DinB
VTAALDHVLRHNAWANKTLLEHCAGLGADALKLSAEGTFGTLYGTLQHIVGGEQWYISLLTGEELGRPIRRSEPRPLDELISIAARTGQRAVEIARSDDADRKVAVNSPEDSSTVGTVLAQLVHHSNEHRTHATTILSVNGKQPPFISGWRYGRVAGLSKHDGDD